MGLLKWRQNGASGRAGDRGGVCEPPLARRLPLAKIVRRVELEEALPTPGGFGDDSLSIHHRFTILVVGVRKGKREEGASIGKRREASDIAPPPSTILSDAAWAAYSRPADSLVTLRSTYFLLH